RIYSASTMFTYDELKAIDRFIKLYGLHTTKELERRLEDYRVQDDNIIKRVLNNIIDKHLKLSNNIIGNEILSTTRIQKLKDSLVREVIRKKSEPKDRYYLGDPCSTSL